MLHVGNFPTSRIDGNEADAAAFEVLNEIRAGVLALVWHVRRLDSRQEYAAKIPKTMNAPEYRDEYEIMSILNAYFEGTTHPDRIPVPRFVELRRFDVGHTYVDGLLMEYIPPRFPELQRVIADKLAVARGVPSDEERERMMLEVEIFAWECALTYIEVMDAALNQAHIATMDRKGDTFRYDPSSARLIVLDWNQFDRWDGSASHKLQLEKSLLRAFGQYWYTMITQRQAHIHLPAWHADTTWGMLTLFSRVTLKELVTRQSYVLETAKRAVDDFIRIAAEALRGSTSELIDQYRKEQVEWQTQREQVSLRGADGLVWTDLARRTAGSHQSEAANAYFAMVGEMQKTGIPINKDSTSRQVLDELSKQQNNAKSAAEREYYTVMRETSSILSDITAEQSKRLLPIISEMSSVLAHHPDSIAHQAVEQANVLRNGLERLRQQFYSITGKEYLPAERLVVLLELYQRLSDLHDAWAQGDRSAALSILDRIEALSTPEREDLIGFSVKQLREQLQAATVTESVSNSSKKTHNLDFDQLHQAYQSSIEVDTSDALDVFIDRLVTAMQAPSLSQFVLNALGEYLEITETLRGVFVAHYSIEDRQQALLKLVGVVNRYPQLRMDLSLTRFSKAFVRDWQDAHQRHKEFGFLPPTALRTLVINLKYLMPQEKMHP